MNAIARWLSNHWPDVAGVIVGTLAFVSVAAFLLSFGLPFFVSLAAAGFASGAVGYAVGSLFHVRLPTLREALIQGAVASVVTVATFGAARALAPLLAGLVPAGVTAMAPTAVRQTAAGTIVGGMFGGGLQAIENRWRGRPLGEGVGDAAALGAINGAISVPLTAAAPRAMAPRVLSVAELAVLADGRLAAREVHPVDRQRLRPAFDEAARYVNELVRARSDLSLPRIAKINEIFTRGGWWEQQGKTGLRSTAQDRRVISETSPHEYVAPERVADSMNEFFVWYRGNEGVLPPTELAAQTLQYLERIHPFFDANGLTNRLVMDWSLQRNGLPPADFRGLRAEAVLTPTDAVTANVSRGVGQALAAIAPPLPTATPSKTAGFVHALSGESGR